MEINLISVGGGAETALPYILPFELNSKRLWLILKHIQALKYIYVTYKNTNFQKELFQPSQ